MKWRNLVKTSDGIVIYMGIKNLRSISEELILGGLQKETPVAIIYQGTLSQQICHKTTLESLHQEIVRDRIKSSSKVVIGKVVNHQVLKCAPKLIHFEFEDIKLRELVTKLNLFILMIKITNILKNIFINMCFNELST